MSVRRINFLSRQKINSSDVRIQLVVSGATKRFAASVDLASYKFPGHARIFVDVTQSSMELMRFDFGSIAVPKFREEDISRLSGDGVVFNLYVIEPSTAQKLGVAEAIRIKSESSELGGANSLLPVDGSRDLSGLLWSVAFDTPGSEGASDAPVLCIDKEASRGSASDFINDPRTAALVLPAAMRIVLSRILLNDDEFAYDSTSLGWRHAWVRFAINQNGDSPPNAEEEHEVVAWIERACAAFSRRSSLRERFIKLLEQ